MLLERSEYVSKPFCERLYCDAGKEGELEEDKKLTGPQISISFLAESNFRWTA
jgi:hypothetical protein